MCKLGDGEPVHPVVLVVVDVQPEVLLQLLVDPFCLPVGLGVVRVSDSLSANKRKNSEGDNKPLIVKVVLDWY